MALLLPRRRVLAAALAGGVALPAFVRHAAARDEDRFAVVGQLPDGFADVGEGPVSAVLGWSVEIDPRVPAAREFLDAGDIDTGKGPNWDKWHRSWAYIRINYHDHLIMPTAVPSSRQGG